MIKTLIKLALVALIANGCYRVGSAYVTHYRFRDAVQEVVQFRGNKDDSWVHEKVMDLAKEYDVPLNDSAVEVQDQRLHTIVSVNYTRKIDILPGFRRDWPFYANVDVITGLK
ncbi:MAG TPA: hypothetical protein VIW45_06170 [Vicinamibacterales bacterium]|jgi:hypothetical protein